LSVELKYYIANIYLTDRCKYIFWKFKKT